MPDEESPRGQQAEEELFRIPGGPMWSTRWLLQSSRKRGSNRGGGTHPERLGDPRIEWGGGLPQSIGRFQLPANGVGSYGRVIERLADLRESDFEVLSPAVLPKFLTERSNKCLPRTLARKHVVAVVTSVDDVMPRTWKLNANSSCHDSDATFALTLSVRTPNPTGGERHGKPLGGAVSCGP
jgi:hypothetical protein